MMGTMRDDDYSTSNLNEYIRDSRYKNRLVRHDDAGD